MKVNCIGDSHVSVFCGHGIININQWIQTDIFNVNHMGPILAYTLMEKEDILAACKRLPKDEPLLLCFGEIDCRAQVGRRISENKDYKMVIDEIISRYMDFIDLCENKHIIILGVTPCLKEKPFEKWFEEDQSRKDIFCATRGTKEERNLYKSYFNQELKAKCEEKNLRFISVSDEVLDKEELYLDDIHLNGEMVFQLLKDKFNLPE